MCTWRFKWTLSVLGDSYGLLTTQNLLFSLQLASRQPVDAFHLSIRFTPPYTYDELLCASLLSFNSEIPLENLKNHQKESIRKREKIPHTQEISFALKMENSFLAEYFSCLCLALFHSTFCWGWTWWEIWRTYEIRWVEMVKIHCTTAQQLGPSLFTFIFTFQIQFNITSHHIEQHTCFVVRSMKKSLSVWIGYTQHSSSQATGVLWFWQWCWWWNMKFQFVESSLHCQKVGIELHFFFVS